jgi:HSP20 family protein
LDEKINPEGIDATYQDGLLLLTLPKKEEVKILPKEISVK